ncbi:hypothetical protein NQ318_006980 [Aromia moschata]|uniref:PiggyBac transposable element-derived protein domain-containing protein n=1 Tax=Aromia moschata TaxID=1265417 RepID=A0AAV8X9B3_9CUCU|nr:hypothetical protein NQ318_006980 [Aromia moschata]
MPNKPAKYCIKMYALVDSKSFYVLNLEVYVGLQPEGPFRLSNKPEDIVLRLVEPIRNSSRNVTFANWFSGYPLLGTIQATVGTIRKNKKEIPPQLLACQNREAKSSQCAFQQDVTLISYIPKKGKNVLLISTLHHGKQWRCIWLTEISRTATDGKDTDTSSDEVLKPEMITFYNSTKDGVDIVDELSGSYIMFLGTVKNGHLLYFFLLLNSAGINAMVIYNANHPEANVKRIFFLETIRIISD